MSNGWYSCPEYVTASGYPLADFEGVPVADIETLFAEFTDLTTGYVTNWAWDFGDGGVSNTQNPTHNYTTVGSYTVTLNAYSKCGFSTEAKVAYVDVIAAPDGARSEEGGDFRTVNNTTDVRVLG